jgi:hypothetical protein
VAEDKEIAAMSVIAKALDGFTNDEALVRERILQWACSRYGVPSGKPAADARKSETDAKPQKDKSLAFESFADLYHATDPQTDIDRALVAGYFLGQGETRVEFTGMDANKELKNLGHPVGNITDALQALIDRRPALVMQTAKSGASRQARKKYKLTHAGATAVANMSKSKE